LIRTKPEVGIAATSSLYK